MTSSYTSTAISPLLKVTSGVACYWQVIDNIEIWSIQQNKTRFLPNCSCVNTIVWMHHLDSNKTHWEKPTCKVHSNATSCFEQILEVKLYKTVIVRPLTSHLTNYETQTKSTCRALPEMHRGTHQWRSLAHCYVSLGRLARTYIHQLCGYDM